MLIHRQESLELAIAVDRELIEWTCGAVWLDYFLLLGYLQEWKFAG